MQLMTDALGGDGRAGAAARVRPRDGHASTPTARPLFADVPATLRVWASHGDFVAARAAGVRGRGDERQRAGRGDGRRPSGGSTALLFHPEVAHTEHGAEILRNFAFDVCGCTRRLDDGVVRRRERSTRIRAAGRATGRVVCGLSGRRRFDRRGAAHPPRHRRSADLHLRRQRPAAAATRPTQVRTRFAEKLHLPLDFVDASRSVPRAPGRRHRSGAEAEDHRRDVHRRVREDARASWAASTSWRRARSTRTSSSRVSVVGPSAAIKSHHNVGGLPERMRFKLVEPLRELFKDEVRAVGRDARASTTSSSWRQPFPGPGPGGAHRWAR